MSKTTFAGRLCLLVFVVFVSSAVWHHSALAISILLSEREEVDEFDIDRQDANHFFVKVRESREPYFETHDGGATFAMALKRPMGQWVGLSEQTSDIRYALKRDRGDWGHIQILRSEDGGNQWVPTHITEYRGLERERRYAERDRLYSGVFRAPSRLSVFTFVLLVLLYVLVMRRLYQLPRVGLAVGRVSFGKGLASTVLWLSVLGCVILVVLPKFHGIFIALGTTTQTDLRSYFLFLPANVFVLATFTVAACLSSPLSINLMDISPFSQQVMRRSVMFGYGVVGLLFIVGLFLTGF